MKKAINEFYMTDYYQLAMNYIYLLEDKADEKIVFEAFVRNIRDDVTNGGNYYIFGGNLEVNNYLEKIKELLKDYRRDLLNEFLLIMEKKVDKKIWIENLEKLKDKFLTVETEFKYTLADEGAIIKPYQPVFQYEGPRWIGQLIETKIVNMINGKTGLNSYLKGNIDKDWDELKKLSALSSDVYEEKNIPIYNDYKEGLLKIAKEYRVATDKPIMEAGFRRAPGLVSAIMASKIAIDENWNGTSNMAAYYSGLGIDNIGGSCSHSFVMAFKSELDAFKTWCRYFPNNTLLIDTYDVMEAAKLIVENNLNCKFVRIDSEPLDVYAKEVRKYFDDNDREDIGIFISGDLTPERLIDFNNKNIPYDLSMAGTKFVNYGVCKKINPGFVYKLVVNRVGEEEFFPEKKATGKKSYAGYKKVYAKNGNIVVEKTDGEIGIIDSNCYEKKAQLIMKGF